ncbi:MAG: hypothetical protein SYR96_03800 [Actinomycetota bacterium]|nr:hypothetical protein [Actinomycetota bacterium]
MEGNNTRRPAGPIKVTLAPAERRRQSAIRWLVLVLTAVLTAAAVILGARLLGNSGVATAAQTPREVLDARDAKPAAAAESVAGTTRFVPIGPDLVLDTRGRGPVAPGADTEIELSDLPADTSAVLAEVSVLESTGEGDLTIDGGAGPVTVLRVPKAGVQTTANAIVQVGPDRTLVVKAAGGGDVLVNLVGAFQPAQTSAEGRIVPMPPAEVVHLVPKKDGKEATIKLSDVDALRNADPSAILLQVAGDVGPNGGRISAGADKGTMLQTLFWGPTKGADRTRVGFLAVPVTGDVVRLRYVAGTEMRADLVGYVTGKGAEVTDTGLIVPVTPANPDPVRVDAGLKEKVAVVPSGIPAPRVAAALLSVTATGDAVGKVNAYQPGTKATGNPTVVAPRDTARAAFALVGTADGAVQVSSEAGAAVSLTARALILGAP